MPATKKTDNHYLADKVELRLQYSPWRKGRQLRVLDAFGGKGVVWAAVQERSGMKVDRVSIDLRKDMQQFHLHGDNLKVIPSIDVNGFDVVDLDAYGVPCAQIELLAKAAFTGVVFVTCIQTAQGTIPKALLDRICIPSAVSKLAPTLVARRGWEYFKEWLATIGVFQIVHRSNSRKHYLAFRFNGAVQPAEGCGSQVAGISASPS